MSLYSIPLVNQSIDRNQSRQLTNSLGRNLIFQGIAISNFSLDSDWDITQMGNSYNRFCGSIPVVNGTSPWGLDTI